MLPLSRRNRCSAIPMNSRRCWNCSAACGRCTAGLQGIAALSLPSCSARGSCAAGILLLPPQPWAPALRGASCSPRTGLSIQLLPQSPAGWAVPAAGKVNDCNYGSLSQSEAVEPHENVFLLQLWICDSVVAPPLQLFPLQDTEQSPVLLMGPSPQRFSANTARVWFHLTTHEELFARVGAVRQPSAWECPQVSC